MTASSRVDPAALGSDNDRHDAKAGRPGADEVVRGIFVEASAVAREPAERMRALPKKPESLPLDEIEQRLVRHARAGLAVF